MPALRIPFFPFCPEQVQNRELAEECRVCGAGEYESLWNRWHGQLHALRLEPPAVQGAGSSAPMREGQGILCLWLDETVERVVDGLWESSPSLAYGAHLLALELCMASLRVLLPEAASNALPRGRGYCAPLAVPDAGQAQELRQYGILGAGPEAGENPPALLRRYAVLTWMPFRGGCVCCVLRHGCPRLSGETGQADA